MKEKRLIVSLPGRSVGELRQNRSGLVQWIPDPDWEDEGQMPRLGFDFLRRLGPRDHASDLPAWFENLLPERGSVLRTRLCQHHGLRDGQAFPLLRALGRDLIGAVEVRDAAQERLEGTSDASAGTETPGRAESAESADRLSALTGMQLKFSMSMVNERLVLPAVGSRSQWIVKIPGSDYAELAEVENATMTWARLAGFDVPSHAVMPFSALEGVPLDWIEQPAPVFAIQRFDRRADGSKVHQEDLCQALGLRPQDKYGDRVLVSYSGATRLVVDACGEHDGREMARRIGFVIASGNSDAHLKNFSLVWGDRIRPVLAPCYDLVSTIAWPTLGWQRPDGPRLALRLGGESLFKRLDAAAVERFASDAGYAWVKEAIFEGMERARGAWPEVAGSTPLRMRAAIMQHWRAVPVLASMGTLPA